MAINRFSQSTAQEAFPKFTNLWDGTTATSSFDSLGAVLLSSATSTITFSNIPQTYTHLQIRGMSLSNSAEQNLKMQFNSDTGANYSRHYLGGNGTSGFAGATANESYSLVGLAPNSTQPGLHIIDVLEYSSTSKYKTTRAIYGDDKNGGTGYIVFSSGSWRNSSAITRIDLSFTGSAVFNQYSSFSLYGIK